MQRETWSSGAGFVFAAVGSAVGLGNMWRFSATAASTGGAGFVAVYVFMVLLIGLPLLLAELILGRRFQSSPVPALTRAIGGVGGALGWFFVLTAFVILSFYSVIAGWTLRYGLESIAGGWEGDLATHFLSIATGPAALVYHLVFMVLTMVVVLWGIKGGIEKFASAATPVLFVILVGLALWAAFLRGAGDGYAFYLAPDLSVLGDPAVWRAAAGQTYFSMSIGMGAMLTYASYLRSSDKLASEATVISLADFAVAFMAGLVIFPILFSFGLGEQATAAADQAEGVLFIALPTAFQDLGTTGYFVGVVFFVALILAALTSTISLMEVIVSTLIDRLSVSRRSATVGVALACGLIGILPALSLPALSRMNQLAGEMFLGFGAFAIALLVGWFLDDPRRELRAALGEERTLMVNGWYFIIRWLAPLITGFVVVNMLMQYFGA